ncbi:unnamed protein product [Prorocentrum cordatum]|uniref:CAP-Gly domain-containing protein n=1 Tax=Prorocentrum cordatum TaxID=2364126 RepID=A0ABN9U7Z0_9DINO|nr:unnamed protein product [Polarella glacialis]
MPSRTRRRSRITGQDARFRADALQGLSDAIVQAGVSAQARERGLLDRPAEAQRCGMPLEDLPPGVVVGGRVVVNPGQLKGTLRFFGQTKFSTGMWAGVELDTLDGKNDGSVKGERYFTCVPQMGLFTRLDTLEPDNLEVLRAAVSGCAAEVDRATATVGRLGEALASARGAGGARGDIAGGGAGARSQQLDRAADQMARRLEERLRESLEEQLRQAASGPLEELRWLAGELRRAGATSPEPPALAGSHPGRRKSHLLELLEDLPTEQGAAW